MSKEVASQAFKPTAGERVYFALSRLREHRERRKQAGDALRAGADYEKRSLAYTEAQTAERGRAMMSAGQSYLNGGDLVSAQRTLETAEPDLAVSASTGTFDSQTTLGRFYPVLEAVYGATGQTELFESVRAKAVAHDAMMEATFGLKTQIMPDGSRIVG